jgi:hypothetical protein
MPKPTALLNEARAGLGLAPLSSGTNLGDVMRSPFLHLMPTTDAFEYPRKGLESQVHFVGPLIPPAPERFAPPPWWAELSERPVVHVTRGTRRIQADFATHQPAREAAELLERLAGSRSPVARDDSTRPGRR